MMAHVAAARVELSHAQARLVEVARVDHLRGAGARAAARGALRLLQRGQAAALRRWMRAIDAVEPRQRLHAVGGRTLARLLANTRRGRLTSSWATLRSFGASRVATEQTRAVEMRSLLLARTHNLHRHRMGAVFLSTITWQRLRLRAYAQCWGRWQRYGRAMARRNERAAADTRARLLDGVHSARSQRLAAQRAAGYCLRRVQARCTRALRRWAAACHIAAGHEAAVRATAARVEAEEELRCSGLRAKVAAT